MLKNGFAGASERGSTRLFIIAVSSTVDTFARCICSSSEYIKSLGRRMEWQF